jgi:hypothetical protein
MNPEAWCFPQTHLRMVFEAPSVAPEIVPYQDALNLVFSKVFKSKERSFGGASSFCFPQIMAAFM